jgi:NAD(P)-dependent dehydrogenase (short-subunit alcohol dehydrogenase family)
MTDFTYKTALVTGAAAGIGRALCQELCRRGALVYAGDIQEEKLASLVASAEGPGSITAVALDVSQSAEFAAAYAAILSDHGRLDLAINNAGIVIGGDFRETSIEDIEKITSINYWGVIYGTRQAYEIMVEQGRGQIVNVASPAGVMPVPMSTAYSATKHAVVGLSHSLRAEAALYGVQVNVVLPGMVKSELWENAINTGDYDYKEEMESTSLAQITAAEAALAILRGVERDQENIVFPLVNRIIVKLYQMFPGLLTRVVTAPLLRPLRDSLANPARRAGSPAGEDPPAGK